MPALSRVLSALYLHVLVPTKTKVQCWRYRAVARTAAPRARVYRPGDERAIIRLFEATFRKRKSMRRWTWEFLENPYGRAGTIVLEADKAGIVGHMGGILVRFKLHGDLIPAVQLVDVMIHPAFRSRASFVRLGRAYIQHSRENGFRLACGFNEGAVARSYRRFFGVELAPVSEWVHEFPGSRAISGPAEDEPEVSPAAGFDARADALWARIQGSYPCATVRDSRYLNWRYSPRSDRDYTVWQATDPLSGRIVALLVLGASGSDGLILELLSDPDDAKSIAALLRASLAHFARSGKARVRVWLSGHGKLRECAQEAGFRAADSDFHLNLLPIDESLDAAALKRDFYYTLGDYDVY